MKGAKWRTSKKGAWGTFAVLVAMVLLVVYFLGFKVAVYDDNSRIIGTRFVFNEPMVYLSNIPGSFAGKHIANKYGSIILDRESVNNWTSGILTNASSYEISCDEIFTITAVFTITPYGVLSKGVADKRQYYVLDSDKYPKTVFYGDYFGQYTHKYSASVSGAGCTNAE